MTTKTESALARISHKRIDKVSANVLIVVDKYVPGKMLKHLLDEQYNIVGICTSCQEALKKISEIHPDLILTDVALQDCDGIYFAQQLNLKGENSSLCIYFTEYTSDLIVQQTMIAANKLGCSIISYGSNEHRTNFESRFCEYYGIENRTSLIEELPIQPIRVFLVDDQQIVLWGLEKLIDGERPRMEVVGKSANKCWAVYCSRYCDYCYYNFS